MPPGKNFFSHRFTAAALNCLAAATFVVFFAAHAARADETPAPIGHWQFDQTSVAADRVKDRAGKLDAVVSGPLVIADDVPSGAIVLDGEQQSIAVVQTPVPPAIPKRELTAEAWVNIAEPREWGGIVTALQDNGDFERGWLLGFRQSNFCFALCGGESAKLTYMTADAPFEPGSWHHVAATYDGREMRLYVDGRLAGRSQEQHGDIRYPPKFFYDLAAYHDDDEHYRWPGMIHEVAVYDRALDEKQIAARFAAKRRGFIAPLRVTVGPYARHLDHATVEFKWQTDVAVPTLLEYRLGSAPPRRVGRDEPTKSHTVRIDDVEREGRYTYRILAPAADGTVAAGRTYNFDATFDYTQDAPPDEPSPFVDDAATPRLIEYAELAIKHAATRQGICLVVGSARGRLAYEIARRSQFQVIVVEPDEAAAAEARSLLSEAGYYGQRVSVHRGPLDALPYADYLANVVVSAASLDHAALDRAAAADLAPQWIRCVRPAGGVMLLGVTGDAEQRLPRIDALQSSLAAANVGKLNVLLGEQASWLLLQRDELLGAGDWSHQYGLADNASCSRDELASGEMRPLWFGQPGARPMPDRGGRNPAPLAAGGNLYVEGDRILFGMDAYNGTIRWVYQIPDLRRSNVPRDSSNLAAGKDVVHVAVGSSCLTIDAITGEVRSTFAVSQPAPQPEAAGDVRHEWGYLARVGDAVLGTAVRARAAYVADNGEWYDGKPGWETEKVVGENLFALDAKSGQRRWEYRGGRVLNSTITVGDGRVYFVESRSPQAASKKGGRLGDEALDDTYLIALDLETGRPLWQSPVDFGTGRRALYLSHHEGTLVAAGSSDDYRIAAFDATTGGTKWRRQFPWHHEDHGGAIQHPVLVDGVVFTEFQAFALADGKPQPGLPSRGHGCGAQAASLHAFFYRGGYHTMFDIQTRRQTEMAPARSGCWLGIIPAGGIVIAPETSSGCSCTHALQTSMAFVPIKSNTFESNAANPRDEPASP
ncbi:MAG: LamG-like jellyroll fold domain-containing protein [Pirellulales bacterium]